MYPQISFPDLKYQLKLFDVVVDIVYFQVIGDNMKNYSSIARKDKSVFISVNFKLGAGYYLYTYIYLQVIGDNMKDYSSIARKDKSVFFLLPYSLHSRLGDTHLKL